MVSKVFSFIALLLFTTSCFNNKSMNGGNKLFTEEELILPDNVVGKFKNNTDVLDFFKGYLSQHSSGSLGLDSIEFAKIEWRECIFYKKPHPAIKCIDNIKDSLVNVDRRFDLLGYFNNEPFVFMQVYPIPLQNNFPYWHMHVCKDKVNKYIKNISIAKSKSNGRDIFGMELGWISYCYINDEGLNIVQYPYGKSHTKSSSNKESCFTAIELRHEKSVHLIKEFLNQNY